MKKTLLVAFALITSFAYAQNGPGFGIKGGLNYNANGKYFEDAGNAIRNPDRNIGYHIGIFGKIGNNLYLRPELVYTKTKSDYNGDAFDMKKIDAPILVGLHIIEPISIFAGPSLQYIVDTDLEGITLDDVENEFTVGLNIGAALALGKLGIDVRYERGLKDNEATFAGLQNGRIDTRPDQIIFSLSVKL